MSSSNVSTAPAPQPKATKPPTIGIAQSTPQTAKPIGATSTVTTNGSIVQSHDPSTRADASLAEKLTGDLKGALNGTVGSLQAATGAAIRNKGLEEKGLDKMQDEDERLGSKRGVMPVGSSKRETEMDLKRVEKQA